MRKRLAVLTVAVALLVPINAGTAMAQKSQGQVCTSTGADGGYVCANPDGGTGPK
jgi:hypothetical protein